MSRGLSNQQNEILSNMWMGMLEAGLQPIVSLAYFLPDDPDADERKRWNVEQSIRRSLRLLEQRGLIDTGSYWFHQQRHEDGRPIAGAYYPVDQSEYVRGKGRIMIGVTLTLEGLTYCQSKFPPFYDDYEWDPQGFCRLRET